MLTLYQAEWCPSCHTVRQVLTELGLTYVTVNVAASRDERADVMARLRPAQHARAAGRRQGLHRLGRDHRVPAGHVPGARRRRGARRLRAPGARPARSPSRRAPRSRACASSSRPRGSRSSRRSGGPRSDERLPKEYVLLHVTDPGGRREDAWRSTLSRRRPCCSPMAVHARRRRRQRDRDRRPRGQVWLYGEPPLNRIQAKVKERLAEVFSSDELLGSRGLLPAEQPQAQQRRHEHRPRRRCRAASSWPRGRSTGPRARSPGGRAAAPCRCPPSRAAAGRAAPTCPRRTA